jgi:hypothetical protein
MSAVSLSLVAVLAIAYRVRRNRMSRQVAENIVLRAGGS